MSANTVMFKDEFLTLLGLRPQDCGSNIMDYVTTDDEYGHKIILLDMPYDMSASSNAYHKHNPLSLMSQCRIGKQTSMHPLYGDPDALPSNCKDLRVPQLSLYNLALTSPLGFRIMKCLNKTQKFVIIRDYEFYCKIHDCNKLLRLKNGPNPFPVTYKNTYKISAQTHQISFSRLQRIESLYRIETGLNFHSHYLLSKMKQCSVRLKRLSPDKLSHLAKYQFYPVMSSSPLDKNNHRSVMCNNSQINSAILKPPRFPLKVKSFNRNDIKNPSAARLQKQLHIDMCDKYKVKEIAHRLRHSIKSRKNNDDFVQSCRMKYLFDSIYNKQRSKHLKNSKLTAKIHTNNIHRKQNRTKTSYLVDKGISPSVKLIPVSNSISVLNDHEVDSDIPPNNSALDELSRDDLLVGTGGCDKASMSADCRDKLDDSLNATESFSNMIQISSVYSLADDEKLNGKVKVVKNQLPLSLLNDDDCYIEKVVFCYGSLTDQHGNQDPEMKERSRTDDHTYDSIEPRQFKVNDSPTTTSSLMKKHHDHIIIKSKHSREKGYSLGILKTENSLNLTPYSSRMQVTKEKLHERRSFNHALYGLTSHLQNGSTKITNNGARDNDIICID